jgi:acetyl-CoA carboxylase biotin carboxylase subunit
MGDKIEAKRTAKELGIPVVPGSEGGVTSETGGIRGSASDIGYPVLVKATAGGGGRGMKVARTEGRARASPLHGALRSQGGLRRRRGLSGKDISQKPRHIEIQMLGDGQGGAVHLGERDCSLQRRHQKVLGGSPSPALNAAQRDQIGEICAKAMREMKYLGAGTVEFLYEDGEFYFIEMNTRIQVEHPVTEMHHRHRSRAGADPHRRAANCSNMSRTTSPSHGHAIECRINAENPSTFRPFAGARRELHPPGGLGVRIDSAAYQGYRIPPYYDSSSAS